MAARNFTKTLDIFHSAPTRVISLLQFWELGAQPSNLGPPLCLHRPVCNEGGATRQGGQERTSGANFSSILRKPQNGVFHPHQLTYRRLNFFSAPKSRIGCRFVMSAEFPGIWNWELDAVSCCQLNSPPTKRTLACSSSCQFEMSALFPRKQNWN